MNIVQISQAAKLRVLEKKETVRIRHGQFKPGEYIEISDEYPNFHSNESGQLIEWYPSLDDLTAADWEFVN